ncbi:MAG: GHKL domain-containing protein [Bacilli bacterium]|nr:GHKL domain-containing protein [Bacilli bacterium]
MVMLIFSFLIKILFKQSIKKAITTAIYYELIIVLSEGLFVLLMSLLFNMDSFDIVETQFASFFANISIAIISIVVINIKFIKEFYNLVNAMIDKIRDKHLIIMCLITTIVINILEATLYYHIDFRYLLIINILLILLCFGIVLYSFNTKNKYNKVYDKYNTTLNSLKEYEEILDKYRMSNHENKNQLLTIRNMLPKTNKKIITYIDEVVNNKLKDDEKIMHEVSIIPAGGLRGLVYSKILYMKELNIDYILEISKEIKTATLIDIDDFLMLDICKVIGVYLDNSIQAINDLKNKYINIQMYIDDDNLIISISNNYEGYIDISKINEKGYSSKGKDHGYGLSLAKQIIDNNKKLKNETSISKNIFTQTLRITI